MIRFLTMILMPWAEIKRARSEASRMYLDNQALHGRLHKAAVKLARISNLETPHMAHGLRKAIMIARDEI